MARGRPLLHAHRKTESRHRTYLPPNIADYIRDWAMLEPGEHVFLVEDNRPELSGRIDAVTEDGLNLWLQLDEGAGRRLFTRMDAVFVWRVPVSK